MASKTEGDINLSHERKKWQKNHISPQTKALLEEDSRYFIHQALSTPCLDCVTGAEGIYLITNDGQKIMDFHGNSVHQLGYHHPYLTNAFRQQLEELSFSPRRFTNKTAVALAKKLSSLTGGNRRVLFTPSGSASISIALKMVRYATGKFKTVSLWDSFHGANLDAVSVGGENHFRNGIGPLLPGCEHMIPYNSYRCLFGDCRDCRLKCLDYLEYICRCEGDIGAIVMEPIRCTDVQIPPKEYYSRVRQICDAYDIALIFDEIPTAFGRTGKMFAYENYSIEPDILVVGKGLGGALYPISAVIAHEKFNVCQEISLGHYTHEKSPLGTAVGLALIDYIEKENLLDRTVHIEHYIRSRTEKMQKKYPCIGDIRGIGALFAIELVEERDKKTKAEKLAEQVLYYCLSHGLSFKISQGNVLTLAPPLIISDEQLKTSMDILEDAFAFLHPHF